MKQFVVDTNVIIRFLVGDDLEQQHQAERWFKRAERGQIKIIISPIVIAESCFVLESFYQRSRSEIADVMQVLVSQRWLRVEQREVLQNLWKFYTTGLHFVDSYLLSWAQLEKLKLLSLDKWASRKITN